MAKISLDEQLLTFAEAAGLLPRRRAGRKVHPATLFRWSRTGIRNVRLETIRIGGTLCTSREALQRFFDALTQTDSTSGTPASTSNKRAAEQRTEVAERELSKRGI